MQAHLSIEYQKNKSFLFKSEGVRITYFVIWSDDNKPKVKDWYFKLNESDSTNYIYTLEKEIEFNDHINFHVYDGNDSEHFQGEIIYTIQQMEEEKRRKKNENNNNIDKAIKELEKMEINLLNNFQVQVKQKEIENIYKEYNLFIDNIIQRTNLLKDINNNFKSISDKILKEVKLESKHFNILLLGKTGVGKSNLINSVLKLNDSEKAKEGYGKNTTKSFIEYTSIKRPGLRLIDSKGIEIGQYNKDKFIKETTKYIEEIAKKGNADEFINGIWYCIQSDSERFEEEIDVIKELNELYEEKKLPIIFVLTKSFDEKQYLRMQKELENLGIKDIVPVMAKEKKLIINKKEIISPVKNLEELIALSFDKCKNSGYSSFKKSLTEKIYDYLIKINQQKFKNNDKNLIKVNKKNVIQSFKNNITKIIYEYIGKQFNQEIENIVNYNTNIFLKKIRNNENIFEIINLNYQNFQYQYSNEKDKILSNCKVFSNELNNTSDYIYNYIYSYYNISNKVYEKVISTLSEIIFCDLNNSILNFIYEEIKREKNKKIDINLQQDIVDKIKENSEKIYNTL